MTAPVILVAGTWGGKRSESQWWQPRSLFARMLEAGGVTILAPEDPFRWTTDLDGLIGKNEDWARAGDALRWYANAKLLPVGGAPRRVSVVSHSHGGNCVAYACASGLLVDRLITVGTPIRREMRTTYEAARKNIQTWIHLYSNSADVWQMFGSWRPGRLLAWVRGESLTRRMKWADVNLKHPGVTHGNLVDPALWRDRRYAFFLAGPPGAVLARVEMIRRRGRTRQ